MNRETPALDSMAEARERIRDMFVVAGAALSQAVRDANLNTEIRPGMTRSARRTARKNRAIVNDVRWWASTTWQQDQIGAWADGISLAACCYWINLHGQISGITEFSGDALNPTQARDFLIGLCERQIRITKPMNRVSVQDLVAASLSANGSRLPVATVSS